MNSVLDSKYMALALNLARAVRHLTRENPRVGCVLVRDDQIIGQGATQPPGGPHAEVVALTQAGDAKGATAYVTLEPCSHTGKTGPCAQALINAGVKRVVAATMDPNPRVNGAGLAMLSGHGIEVECGVLEADAEQLNRGFFRRMRGGLPWVTLKMACSLDGATAMASGESKWITGPLARRQVQRMRARCGAIVTGVGTLLADDPSMNVRWNEAELDRGPLTLSDQPLRVVMDRDGRTPADAQMLALPGPVLIAHERAAGPDREAWLNKGALEHRFETLTPVSLLNELARRGVNEVLVEAGPTLAGAWLAAGVVDRLVVFQAPVLMGSNTRRLLDTPHWNQLSQAQRLELLNARAFGKDMCLEYALVNASMES